MIKNIEITKYLFIIIFFFNPFYGNSIYSQSLRPYQLNPWYWEYKGEPVLLLGGSDDDNLFQKSWIEEHLDLMLTVGANYIRNTMSSRDKGDLQPFKELPDGNYDLDSWNEKYWNNFERMLQLTSERDIFVQIEIWDKWDMSTERWPENPWFPDKNINYDFETTKLKARYGDFMLEAHDFFNSVPALHNDLVLLRYQKRFVDKLLSYTLNFDHVLYSIDNELHPTFSEEWSLYWARYIKEKALETGKKINITEMYWPPELRAKDHRVVLNNPDLFSFFEASQNTSNKTPWQHWRNIQWLRYALKDNPRPINIVKIYSPYDGPGRLWRQIIGGTASSRFHRPPGGIGLNDVAQHHIKSVRMWLSDYDIFTGIPDGDHNYRAGHELMTDRDPEEAYCNYLEGKQYSVYFPDGGTVGLIVPEGNWQVRWLDIAKSEWDVSDEVTVSQHKKLDLDTPGKGHWLALVTLVD